MTEAWLYKRYIKFIESLHKNKRPSLQYLVKLVQRDQRSVTGSNLKNIFSDTGVFVIPGYTKPCALNEYQVYKTPIGENWKIGLLSSLLSIRGQDWTLKFDESDSEKENDIDKTINNVCTT